MSQQETFSEQFDQSQAAAARVPLSVAIAVWVVACIGTSVAVASQAGAPVAHQFGALVGRLVSSLVIALVLRSVVRLVRRRAIVLPLWSPGLFFAAAALSVLALLAASPQQ